MSAAEKPTTTLSTKGQLILPQAIRRKRHWGPGTKLVVEETADGVLLKAAPLFPPTRIEDVYGIARYEGPARTLEDMDAGIDAALKERHARR